MSKKKVVAKKKISSDTKVTKIVEKKNPLTKALDDVIATNEKKATKSKKPITTSNIPVPIVEKVVKEKKVKAVKEVSTEPKVRKQRISKYDPAKVETAFQKAIASGKLDWFFGKEP